ncbi:MAG: alpha/beta hydrolase-fold protein [Flavobacteriales bacterium]|nr:alpha/beta hydrolase-fold protein [Flavobacteriales bacterium]
MKIPTLIYLLLMVFSCTEAQIETQPKTVKPFVLAQIQHLESAILSETRTLNIYFPDGYSPDSSYTYPVIYLFDGSANEDFVHTVGVVQFQTMIGKILPSIVVGIANVDRKRDFTFPTNNAQDKKDYPTTGGSENFISFIEKELQPFIEKTYKVNESKTIVGQSLGGLLAAEILLKKSQLFTHYIIVSPSLWWDDESLLKQCNELLAKQSVEERNIFITVGNEDDQMEAEAIKLAEILKQSKANNWNVNFIPMPEEDHLTILHNALYKGFPMMLPTRSK